MGGPLQLINPSGDAMLSLSLSYCRFVTLGHLNTDVRGLSNYKLVQEAHEQTQQALLEYTINCYPQINVSVDPKWLVMAAPVPRLRTWDHRHEQQFHWIIGKHCYE